MFKKRNFSLIQSPSSRHQTPKFGSPAKRTRLLSSTLRASNFLNQDTSRDNSADRSPLFQKFNESLNLGNKFQLTTLVTERDTKEKTLEGAKALLQSTDDDTLREIEGYANNHLIVQEDYPREAGKIDTPPPTPSGGIESRLDILTRQKEELKRENKKLDEQIEEKLLKIKEIRGKTIELQSKDLVFNEHLEIVDRSQRQVRNLLNEIFNPGNELGKRTEQFIEEVRRRHHKKYEKVTFEMNHLIETTGEAIKKKSKELEHLIEIQERTLMTIECQKRHEESQKVESEPREKVVAEVEAEIEPEAKSHNNQTDPEKSQNDDDCIIIEENDSTDLEVGQDVDLSAHTPEPQDADISVGNNSGENNSATTNTYDDEETDIDEPKEEEGQRSFTPCQAQRPN